MQSTLSSDRMTTIEKRASFSLASIFALRMFGLFIILPVFAIYAEHLPGGENHLLVGLTLGMYGLAQGLLQIPFGVASDRLGRKRVIIIGLVLFAIGSFIAALGTNIWIVMLGRMIQGAGAISAAVTALLADSVRERVITKSMAMIGASIGVTFAVSMVIAPPLTKLLGVSGLFTLTGISAVLAILVTLFIVPKEPNHTPETHGAHQPWQKILLDPQLLRLNIGIFMLHAALTAIFVVVPPWLEDQMGLPSQHHWYVYLPAVFIGFLLMAPLVIYADRHQAKVKVMRWLIALLAIVFCLFSFLMHSIWEVGALLALFFVGFNVLESTLPGLISLASPKADKGLALGIYNTTQNFGLFIGGAVGGGLSQHFGPHAVFACATIAMLIWLVSTIGLKELSPKRHQAGEALKV